MDAIVALSYGRSGLPDTDLPSLARLAHHAALQNVPMTEFFETYLSTYPFDPVNAELAKALLKLNPLPDVPIFLQWEIALSVYRLAPGLFVHQNLVTLFPPYTRDSYRTRYSTYDIAHQLQFNMHLAPQATLALVCHADMLKRAQTIFRASGYTVSPLATVSDYDPGSVQPYTSTSLRSKVYNTLAHAHAHLWALSNRR